MLNAKAALDAVEVRLRAGRFISASVELERAKGVIGAMKLPRLERDELQQALWELDARIGELGFYV